MKAAQSTASVVRNGATLSSLATLPAGNFAKVKFFTFQASVFSNHSGAIVEKNATSEIWNIQKFEEKKEAQNDLKSV